MTAPLICPICGAQTVDIERNTFDGMSFVYRASCATCNTNGVASNTVEGAWKEWADLVTDLLRQATEKGSQTRYKYERDIWRDRALMEKSRAQQALSMLQEQHAYVDETTQAALDTVRAAMFDHEIASAMVMGDTGIGGAL